MKVGILGTGFGAFHAALYSKMNEVDGIFIFGRNRQKLDKLKHGLSVNVTENANELLDNNEIELIDICLPNALHKEYAVKALQRGKHVFCETPVAVELKDAEEIRDTAEKYGRKVFVDLFTRFIPTYSYLQQIFDKKVYGRLKTLRIQRKTPPIWGDLGPEKIVTDLMIHDIDYITWLLGGTDKVTVCCTQGKSGQCSVSGLLEYDGAYVELAGSSMMPMGYPFAVAYEAVFEEGAVRYAEDGYKEHEESVMDVFTNSGKEAVDIKRSICYENAIRHVISRIRDNEPAVNGIDDAVASLELALRIKSMIV